MTLREFKDWLSKLPPEWDEARLMYIDFSGYTKLDDLILDYSNGENGPCFSIAG